jgi:hypothetical protein
MFRVFLVVCVRGTVDHQNDFFIPYKSTLQLIIHSNFSVPCYIIYNRTGVLGVKHLLLHKFTVSSGFARKHCRDYFALLYCEVIVLMRRKGISYGSHHRVLAVIVVV